MTPYAPIPEPLRPWARAAFEDDHRSPDRSRALKLAVIRELGETRALFDPMIAVEFDPKGEPLTISWDAS